MIFLGIQMGRLGREQPAWNRLGCHSKLTCGKKKQLLIPNFPSNLAMNKKAEHTNHMCESWKRQKYKGLSLMADLQLPSEHLPTPGLLSL